MAHPNEPSVKALKNIRAELLASEKTDENTKKLRVLEAQILRREAEAKVEEKTEVDVK